MLLLIQAFFAFIFTCSNIYCADQKIDETISVFEIQKYIDEQWSINHNLLNRLEVLKLQPRIYLNAYISQAELNNQNAILDSIQKQIYLNDKLHEEFSYFNLHSVHSIDLTLQKLQLQIAAGLQKSYIFRGLHTLERASQEIQECMLFIETYAQKMKELHSKGFIAPEKFLALSYFHLGKIHRVQAGQKHDQLLYDELLKCENYYLKALALSPESGAIQGALGFLYNDMQRYQEALKCFQNAHLLDPLHPSYLQGIASAYYQIEALKPSEEIDVGNLMIAEENFKRALKRFEEIDAPSGQTYLDYGNLLLLAGRSDDALLQFNEGLKSFPEHSLLLMSRGSLLTKLGLPDLGRQDFITGLASCQDNSIKSDFSEAYKESQKKLESGAASTKGSEGEPLLILTDQQKNRQKLDSFLVKCCEYLYSKKSNKKKPVCFISYAWGIPAYETWVQQLAEDLEKAGIEVLLDRWCISVGKDLMGFVEKMLSDETDKILVIGTKLYLNKYQFSAVDEKGLERVAKVEGRILNYMVRFNHFSSDKIIPILLEGKAVDSLPPLLRMKVSIDFTEGDYCFNLSRLVRDIHGICPRDKTFNQLKKELFENKITLCLP